MKLYFNPRLDLIKLDCERWRDRAHGFAQDATANPVRVEDNCSESIIDSFVLKIGTCLLTGGVCLVCQCVSFHTSPKCLYFFVNVNSRLIAAAIIRVITSYAFTEIRDVHV